MWLLHIIRDGGRSPGGARRVGWRGLWKLLTPSEPTVPRNVEEPPPKRPPYFWWALANALALCFAVVSWMVCLHVFGNPEIPRNYEILRKIGRLP